MESNPEEIIFAFGLKDRANKPRLTVNKKLLVENSSVFNSMLSGNFAIPDVIAIEDIGKSIFQKMVNSINGEQVDINNRNVFRLIYAAEKYMVEPLSQACDKFIIDLVTSDHDYTMGMLNSSLKYNRPAIKEKCLDIILDDPMRFFEDNTFLDIKEDTLKLIITQPKMNCTYFTLLRAAKRWLDNDAQAVYGLGDVRKILKERLGIEVSELKSKKFYNIWFFTNRHENVQWIQKVTENILVNDMLYCSIRFNEGGRPYLHGIVLCIGVHPEYETTAVDENYFSDTITITVSVKREDSILKKIIRVVQQPQSILKTIKIMFPKILIGYKTVKLFDSRDYDDSDEEDDPQGMYEDSVDPKIHVEVDFGSKKFRSVITKHKYRGHYKKCLSYPSFVSALIFSGHYRHPSGSNENVYKIFDPSNPKPARSPRFGRDYDSD